MSALLLLALLSAPAPARADEAPIAREVAETDPDVIKVREALKSDAGMAEGLAARVARSRLIGQITQDQDESKRLEAAREWIKNDPDAAARVAIGLTSDDQSGTTTFEDSILKQMGTSYGANPGAEKSTYGKLAKSAKNSRLLKNQADGLSDDEKREIMRTLFEGNGAQSNKVIEEKRTNGPGGAPPPSGAAPATAYSNYYDRLSGGNIHGYSPQLMSMQSQLNQHRPPGAPALVETGKLDYATLSYPAYGMNFDVSNLEERLRRERVYDLARLAGVNLSARDWKDPDIEAKLLAKIPADKLPARLKTRAELAAKARAALNSFLMAAEKAKNPDAISKGLLIELGQKQKESARWIAAAALEEELSRTDELEGFLTGELLAAIDAVPAAPAVRESYKRVGSNLQEKAKRVKSNAEKALGILQSDAWASGLAQVDHLVAENQDLKRALSRDTDDFIKVPYRVADARISQPHWRDMLDDLAIKWAPSLSYSRAAASRRGRLARYLDVFTRIAAGNAEDAHRAFVNAEPGAR